MGEDHSGPEPMLPVPVTLPSRQARRRTRGLSVRQSGQSFDVVAVYPVAQGLAIHAARLRRFGAGAAIENKGQRQHASGRVGVLGSRSRVSQTCGVELRPGDCNRQFCLRLRTAKRTANHSGARLGIGRVRSKCRWYNMADFTVSRNADGSYNVSHLGDPASHRFVGQVEPAFREHLLDITVAQGEAQIEPYRVAYDVGWELVASIRDRGHGPETITDQRRSPPFL